jgi:hypothetical protein
VEPILISIVVQQQMNASFTSPKRFIMVLGWTFHCTAFRVSSLLIQDGVLCYKLVTIAKGDLTK